MKRIIALLLAIIMAAFTFAACAKDETVGDPQGNETTPPDIKETEAPIPEYPPQEFVYDRVVVVGVDGCGAFFQKTDSPNIDRIFENGAVTQTMKAVMPSSSAPNWGSMLHGVEPEFHALTNDIAEFYEYPINSDFPSIFKVVREAYPDATLASFTTWNPINHGIIETDQGVYKDTADEDELLNEKILAYLDENDPKLLFIQFDEADGAGHGGGYGNEGHLETLTRIDGYIGQIYDLYQDKGRGEKLLFLVTGDHGGTPDGHHGGEKDIEVNIMFAAAGESVVAGGEPRSMSVVGKEEDMSIRDVAAIVLRAFGLEQPDTMTAIVPNNLFTDFEYSAPRSRYKIEYQYEHRTHYAEDTPKEGSGNYITEVFADRVINYLPFDNSIEDVMGTEVTEFDHVNYISGYYGRAANMRNGTLRLDEFWRGSDSFTISFWFQSTEITSDPTVFATKNRLIPEGFGFSLAFRPGAIMFNFGDGKTCMDAEFPMPADHNRGWVHVIFSVDRDANTVSVSYDFEDFIVAEIPEELQGADMDGMGYLAIGQDATRSSGADFKSPLDELIIFDGAFSADDVARLADYYGIK